MVAPDLSAGAYAVDGRLRRSHFTIRGSNFFLLEVESSGAVASERLPVEKVVNIGQSFYNNWTTNRRSQVSSSMTPTGRLPFVYSLQYPPTVW